MKKFFIIIIIINRISLFRNPYIDYHVININEEDYRFILKMERLLCRNQS